MLAAHRGASFPGQCIGPRSRDFRDGIAAGLQLARTSWVRIHPEPTNTNALGTIDVYTNTVATSHQLNSGTRSPLTTEPSNPPGSPFEIVSGHAGDSDDRSSQQSLQVPPRFATNPCHDLPSIRHGPLARCQ